MNRTGDRIRRLERAMARAWPALEETEYDGWVLRFSDGYTKRSNSIQSHSGSQFPLAAKIAHCESLYQERRLPTIFRLTPLSRPEGLDDLLAELGYHVLDPTLVMICCLESPSADTTESWPLTSADQWFDAADGLRELSLSERTIHRQIIEASAGACGYALIAADGEPVACGLGIHVGDTVGLFDVFVHPAHRGKGLGASIVRSILEWGLNRGAEMSYLQVHSHNAPARRLYERFGFEIAYPYWYRIKR